MAQELDEDAMKSLLKWIDSIPLSRPKKSLARDFSDGVLAAEVIKHYFPRMVESHNYQSANSRAQKLTNWTTLNRKVLTKFGFTIPRDIIEDIIQSKQQAVVLFLFGLRRVVEDRLQQNNAEDNEPQYYDVDRGAAKRPVKNVGAGLVPVIPRAKAAPSATKTASDHSMADQLSLTVRAGMPLSQLNIALLDTDTKLILAEKEQALLGNTRSIC